MKFLKKISYPYFISIVIVIIISALYPLIFISFSTPPHEDAAILLRYSKNFADGYGIVWNIGEKPVDGATDFLFMIFTAFLYKIGLSLEIAVFTITYISHILTSMMIFISIRKLYNGPLWMSILSTLYFAIGPGYGYIAAYYGTPFFTLFVTLTFYFSYKLFFNHESLKYGIYFVLLGLISALIRPEGFISTGLMLLGIIWMLGIRKSKKIIVKSILIFGIFGGGYILWRWIYFGYPLPNPYYKKGGFTLYPSSLIYSIQAGFTIYLPFLIIIIVALLGVILYSSGSKSKDKFKICIFAIILIGGYHIIWILLSNEMNYLARFQYPIFPVFLILWPIVLLTISKELNWSKIKFIDLLYQKRIKVSLIFIILFSSTCVIYQFYSFNNLRFNKDGRYTVGKLLNNYKSKNYSILLSEAGLLPLYSEWNVIDAWGLNNQWIAHHGPITEGYIENFKPEIIMFHAFFSPLIEPNLSYLKDNEMKEEWFLMTLTLNEYAETNNYSLSASFGISPYDTHYYYIMRNFTDSTEIFNLIKNISYIWHNTGDLCNNYAP